MVGSGGFENHRMQNNCAIKVNHVFCFKRVSGSKEAEKDSNFKFVTLTLRAKGTYI